MGRPRKDQAKVSSFLKDIFHKLDKANDDYFLAVRKNGKWLVGGSSLELVNKVKSGFNVPQKIKRTKSRRRKVNIDIGSVDNDDENFEQMIKVEKYDADYDNAVTIGNDDADHNPMKKPMKRSDIKSSKLKRRRVTKEIFYHCKVCRRKFDNRIKCRKHRLTHGGRKDFVCDCCSKSFKRSQQLVAHLRTHKNERSQRCTNCDKNFISDARLKEHMTVHTGETPHLCKQCPAKFNRADHLKRHIRTHTGDRPYQCALCANVAYSENRTLRKHARTMHPAQYAEAISYRKRKDIAYTKNEEESLDQ